MANPQDAELPPLPPTPPDPPDPMEIADTNKDPIQVPKEGGNSFKAILFNKVNSLNGSYLNHHNGKILLIPDKTDDTIFLSDEDKDRIYAP